MNCDAIVLLGGSTLQVPIVELAKAIGFKVILVDADPNCKARSLADDFLNLSCSDYNNIIAMLCPLKVIYNIKGAYCGNDFGLLTVAMINFDLGVSSSLFANTSRSLDKLAAKKIFLENGIPTPRYYSNHEKINLDKLKFPLVVKPLDSSGSRGVSFVSEKRSLKPAIDKAKEYGLKVMIEHAIVGTHIDVSGFFANGSFHPVGQLERFFTDPPQCTPTWGYQPPKIEPAVYQKNYDLLEAASRALGITYGPVKADIIINEVDSYIIEVTPRFHGEISTHYVANKVYGYDGVESWFYFLKTDSLHQNYTFSDTSKCCGWMAIFANKKGKLQKLNFDEIDSNIQIIQTKPLGATIKSIDNNLGVVAFIVASAHSKKELEELLYNASKKVKMWIG